MVQRYDLDTKLIAGDHIPIPVKDTEGDFVYYVAYERLADVLRKAKTEIIDRCQSICGVGSGEPSKRGCGACRTFETLQEIRTELGEEDTGNA